MTTLQHNDATAANRKHEILSTYDQLDPARQDQLAGAVMRATRVAAGMTALAMAKAIECSRRHLTRIESGTRSLTEDVGNRLPRAIADRFKTATA